MNNPYQYDDRYQAKSYDYQPFAIQAESSERATFIQKTYLHLAGAIFLFIALEALYFLAIPTETLRTIMLTMTGGYAWLVVIGMFVGVSFLANYWAQSSTSLGLQYAGLALYVFAQSVIFVPLLTMAIYYQGLDAPPNFDIAMTAGLVTMLIFGGLTLVVFATKTDLSGMGPYLGLAGIAAFAAVICAVLFGFNLGVWFAYAMVVLASGYILYDTSNVMHNYRTTQYVAASLALFASVALLFYYVLIILLNRR